MQDDALTTYSYSPFRNQYNYLTLMYYSQLIRHSAHEGRLIDNLCAIIAAGIDQKGEDVAAGEHLQRMRHQNWLLKHPELRYFTKIPKMARS